MITDHEQLGLLQTKVENDAFTLLALQAPVASDLRLIVSAMQTAADVERMGAVSTSCRTDCPPPPPGPCPALPEEVTGDFAEMGRIAVALGNSARDAVITKDPDLRS